MNAGTRIEEPYSRGKGGNDLVTLPNRHTESATINQSYIAKISTHVRRTNKDDANMNPKYESNCIATRT